MEPLTALGLVANILQFVELTAKLFSKTRDILSGIQDDYNDIRLIAKELRAKAGIVISVSEDGTLPEILQTQDEHLKSLATQCQQIASQLLEANEPLEPQQGQNFWTSFCQALASFWKKREINDLQAKVDRVGNALSNRIVTEQLITKSQRLAQLEHQNKTLEAARTSEIQRLIEAGGSLWGSLKSGDCKARADDALLLLNLAQEEAQYAVEQMVLNNFRFHRMDDRYWNFVVAYGNTFTWAFGTQGDVDAPVSSIVEWFLSHSDLFWVSGKPTSDKLSFMKYLYDPKKTRNALSLWAAGKPVILAGFFWYAAKYSLQKSQQGLLRSLLYQIFRGSPDAIWNVFPDLAKLPQRNHGNNLQLPSSQLPTPPETVHELLVLLRRVCAWLSATGQRCCFLLMDSTNTKVGRTIWSS